MHNPFTLWISFLHVQMICITDLYKCVNPNTVIYLYVLYVYDMFHILLSCDTLRDPWNVCVCMYVLILCLKTFVVLHQNTHV